MGGPLRALIVEDVEDDAMLLVRELERNGYDVSWQRVDTREAMSAALESQTWDIIISDYVMPSFSGPDALALLKESGLDLPFILMSSRIGEEAAVMTLKAGAQDFVLKDNLARLGPAVERELREADERHKQREAEQEIERQATLLRALLDNSIDSIYFKDTEHRFVAVSRSKAENQGCAPQALVGKTDFDFLPQAEAEQTHADEQKVMETGELLANRIEQITHPDGSRHWYSVTKVPYYDAAGELAGIVGVSRDITERMLAEEELRETNRRLGDALDKLKEAHQQMIQQERLHALGQMASGVAHDFNNALTPILLISDSLLARPEGLNDTDRVIGNLERIVASAQSAADVVKRLREFYREREPDDDLQPINCNHVIEQAIWLTRPMWEQTRAQSAQITAEIDLYPLPEVAGDEAGLREAIVNLLINAVDAMPDGGTITLRSRARDNVVVLELSDTGIGMTPEVAQRCLEPFYTTKEQRGTGIGLAMVYGTVERHEGTMEIESEVGEGTTVRIYLPIRAPQTQGGETEMTALVSSPLRLLVVEDDEFVREALSLSLKDDGHSVVEAADGNEGLEKFQAASFDVVITDRAMPGMSGDELAAAIKKVAPDMPVILLTGFGDIMDARGENPADVDLILGKPTTVAALRKAVAEVLAE